MLDLRGTEIECGDELAYAQRDGNGARMRLYQVIEVDYVNKAVLAMPIDGYTNRRTWLTALSLAVVAKKATP
jgi:hypothetical protein